MKKESTVFPPNLAKSAPVSECNSKGIDADAWLFTVGYIPLEHQAVVGKATEVILANITSIVEDLFEIGKQLVLVKEILEHGTFLLWIEEFGYKERTAQRLMNLYRELGTRTEIFRQLKPTALYELSMPSTPKAAVEIVVELLQAGQRLSLKQVSNIIAECKCSKQAEPETIAAQTAQALRQSLSKLSNQVVANYEHIFGEEEAKRLDEARMEIDRHLNKLQARQPKTHRQTVLKTRMLASLPQQNTAGKSETCVVDSDEHVQVVPGCTVFVGDMDTGKPERYILAHGGQDQSENDSISAGSPVAQALLGSRVDEIVIIQTPGGVVRYVVNGIRFTDGRLVGTELNADFESGLLDGLRPPDEHTPAVSAE
ncbi:MAG: GreA/GreB family elongation factor [Caldilineaceae bacterium]|nr:GreA/GreB family elongation factor [Caldilineaceae bacterium]